MKLTIIIISLIFFCFIKKLEKKKSKKNRNNYLESVIKKFYSVSSYWGGMSSLDLPLFKGQIDYNNVSVKNIEESINEVKKKYKKRGYTFMEKGKTEFLFIKGPNTHHVKIMRLGNGLLYFHIKK